MFLKQTFKAFIERTFACWRFFLAVTEGLLFFQLQLFHLLIVSNIDSQQQFNLLT